MTIGSHVASLCIFILVMPCRDLLLAQPHHSVTYLKVNCPSISLFIFISLIVCYSISLTAPT